MLSALIFKRFRDGRSYEGLIPDAIPIVSFGDFELSTIATVGINPSKREFEHNGTPQNRFETLSSLVAETLEKFSDDQVARAYQSCKDYFKNNPYRPWFDKLDTYILNPLGHSYYNGTACHLDLIQSATNPVWRNIPLQIQRTLLEQDVQFLKSQLAYSQIEILLLNGRTVIDEMRAAVSNIGIFEEETLSGKPPCYVFSGSTIVGARSIRIFGWSNNLQSTRVLTNAMRQQIGDWILSRLSRDFSMTSNLISK